MRLRGLMIAARQARIFHPLAVAPPSHDKDECHARLL
jgi:hypothetical protein